MPHTSVIYQLWHLELSLTLPKPRCPCLWNWRVQFLILRLFHHVAPEIRPFALSSSTPDPHQSLLVTLVEFCNPSLSSFALEILLSSFWQKLLHSMCDTMAISCNSTIIEQGGGMGRINTFLENFLCARHCAKGSHTFSVNFRKQLLKERWWYLYYSSEKEPLVVKVIELGTGAHTRAHFRWCWVCILYAK